MYRKKQDVQLNNEEPFKAFKSIGICWFVLLRPLNTFLQNRFF